MSREGARFEEVVRDIKRLEPFPSAAIRVLELALNDADAARIVAVAEQDPGLTSKILRLANSAFSAPRIPIVSVFQASVRLGNRAVASLALTSGCASFFMGYGKSTPRSNTTLWEECLHIALFARRLAQWVGFAEADLAYTVGLLQNIGHVVFDRFLEEERDAILARMNAGEDLLVAERAVLGVNHAQCGARIMKNWGFPDALIRGVLFHHAPSLAGELWSLCAIVNLAEGLTFQTLSSPKLSLLYPVDQGIAMAHTLDDDQIAALAQSVRGEVLDTTLAAA